MGEFTHFNKQGRARMVDISNKEATVRTAIVHSSVQVTEAIYKAIQAGNVQKGNVLSVAQVAGIMAAKKTPDIVPMCHPLPLNAVDISFEWKFESTYELHIEVIVKTKGTTGVEMEALTAATAVALTVYDMCKSFDKGMVIGPTYLMEKTGGKSGNYQLGQ